MILFGMSDKDRQRAIKASSNEELLRELVNRSLGMVCVVITVEDGGKDDWQFAFKGSHLLRLSALNMLSQVNLQYKDKEKE